MKRITREKTITPNMKMTIQSPHFKAQKKLTDFVRKNVGKLEILSDRIVEGKVCLKIEKSGTKENKVCELKLVIPGNDVFTSRASLTFEDAILRSVEAARHQIERWKGLTNGEKHQGSLTSLDFEESEE